MTFWLAVRPAFRRQGLAFEALKAWLGHTFRSHAPVPVTGVVASPLAPPPPVTPPDTYDALAVAHDGDDDDDDDDDHHHVAATSTLSSASPPRTVPLDWRAFPTPPTPLAGGRTDARSASAALPQSAPALAMTTRSPPHRPRAAPRRPTSGHRSAVAQSLATVASRAVCASAPTHGAAMRVLEKMGMSRGFGLDVNLHAQPGPWYGLTRQEFTNLWGGDGDDDDDDDGDDDAADIHSTIALCDGAVDHQCRHFLQPCHESSIHSICSVSRVMYTSF
ncbi:hypothetical protein CAUPRSCDRAFT_11241 [Caulochytrium protostelioides]|nr:hypothetical protein CAUPRSCDRAFT_11241 [Caulochytrium protostelioides]